MSKKIESMIGLFAICLVISMPFYSASALATSVQITRNQGSAGIHGFINGNGDTWTVEATILDALETVNPEDVKIRIGSSEAVFNTCNPGSFGTECSYISPLDGLGEDQSFDFQVAYVYDVLGVPEERTNADVIHIDGTAPKISNLKVFQDNQDVHIDFDVTDSFVDLPYSGLKKIEIFDGDTGSLVQTILLNGEEAFNYLIDTEFEGIIQHDFTGSQGLKRIKVRAEDQLGHKSSFVTATAVLDLVKPQILTNTIEFPSIGRFVSGEISTTDIKIDIRETSNLGDLGEVAAFSDQADLNGDLADCEETEANLWSCIWKNVDIESTSFVRLTILAIDEFGNEKQEIVVNAQEFVADNSAPTIDFFGTQRVFEGQSYIEKNGKNKLVLEVSDSGAGISRSGIRANLGAFSANDVPTECFLSGEVVEDEDALVDVCHWNNLLYSQSSTSVQIGLSRFHDKVGNEGDRTPISLIVDDSGPIISKLKIFGSSAAGDKTYFQSNDRIKINMEVEENSGLTIFVNLKGIVDGAEENYPATGLTAGLGAGWRVYKEVDVCSPGEDSDWVCELETEKIMSGFKSSLPLKIMVKDTAGNDAQDKEAWLKTPSSVKSGTKGNYIITLLGLDSEENPDYWEVSSVKEQIPFIDIDTTEIINSRMPFEVNLKTSSNAKVRKVEIAECVAEDFEYLGRQAVWNNVYEPPASSPKFTLLLEFSSFDAKSQFGLGEDREGKFDKEEIDFTCNIRIYSQLGNTAIESAEIQEFEVSVPFGFSKLGANSANLEERIKKAKHDVNSGWNGFIGEAEKWLQRANQLANLLNVIVQGANFIDLAKRGVYGGLKPAKLIAPTSTAAAEVSFCLGTTTAQAGLAESIEWLQVPLQVLTCQKFVGPDWLKEIHSYVVSSYNELGDEWVTSKLDSEDAKFKFAGQQLPLANSVYDNFYLSVASLCLPGIIHNLDKERQIQCRYISCLEDEVPAGKATVNACGELKDLMECKYVWGSRLQLLPFYGAYEAVVQKLNSIIRDPIALISNTVLAGCAIECINAAGGPELNVFCTQAVWVVRMFDMVDALIGTYESFSQLFGGRANYCDQVL